MHRVTFSLSLVFQAPLLTHTTGAMAFGMDMAMQCYRGEPVINGSLVRGNIREVWEHFLALGKKAGCDIGLSYEDIDRWLGEELQKGEVKPKRAQLNFDYFWRLTDNSSLRQGAESVRYRIGIEAATGTVESGNLQVIESCFPVGTKPCFKGVIRAELVTETEVKRVEKWLQKALYAITAMGALKGVGFGKLVKPELTLQNAPVVAAKATITADRIGILLKLDRPLCAARPHSPNSNRFVSEDFISGSILKGAFAEQFHRAGIPHQLAEQFDFDNLHFTHAVPTIQAAPLRPIPVPLSLVSVAGEILDVALQQEARLLGKKQDDAITHFAPAFQVDWKKVDWELLEKKFTSFKINTHIKPDRLLTVRTAIKSETGTAEENKLFSLECIDSFADDEPLQWCAEITLDHVCEQDRPEVSRRLQEHLVHHGLSRMGKTKVNASVEITAQNFLEQQNESSLIPIDNAYHIVMLRSEARMLPNDPTVPSTNGHAELFKLYSDYFHTASGKLLQLSHFYAQQRLFGGEFYWRHYRSKESNYRPEWLTVAGSVFVLKPLVGKDQQEIKSCLSRWLRLGLPVAQDRKDRNWRGDPLIPENGFGEVVINHRIHQALSQPEGGEWS